MSLIDLHTTTTQPGSQPLSPREEAEAEAYAAHALADRPASQLAEMRHAWAAHEVRTPAPGYHDRVLARARYLVSTRPTTAHAHLLAPDRAPETSIWAAHVAPPVRPGWPTLYYVGLLPGAQRAVRGNQRLSPEDYGRVRAYAAAGVPQQELAWHYKVSEATISGTVNATPEECLVGTPWYVDAGRLAQLRDEAHRDAVVEMQGTIAALQRQMREGLDQMERRIAEIRAAYERKYPTP